MRVLVACEFSGVARNAFASRGHEAWSCDLLASEQAGRHYHGDVRDILAAHWDLVIAHPPCTALASSGARWFPAKRADGSQQAAIDFFLLFTNLTCPWAIENPIGIMSRHYRKPDQIIQPWMFGHGETKATCLWLHKLPCLVPTKIMAERHEKIHKLSALRGPGSSRTRQQDRSRTYQGIADAMAQQWGDL